jgi:hypothetical protein
MDLNKIIGKLEDAKTTVEEVRVDIPKEDRLEDVEDALGQIIDELETINDEKKS